MNGVALTEALLQLSVGTVEPIMTLQLEMPSLVERPRDVYLC